MQLILHRLHGSIYWQKYNRSLDATDKLYYNLRIQNKVQIIMHTLTARLDETLFNATQEQAKAHGMGLSEYLRMALKKLNTEYAKQARYARLQQSSLAVRNTSMTVNQEFAESEEDLFE